MSFRLISTKLKRQKILCVDASKSIVKPIAYSWLKCDFMGFWHFLSFDVWCCSPFDECPSISQHSQHKIAATNKHIDHCVIQICNSNDLISTNSMLNITRSSCFASLLFATIQWIDNTFGLLLRVRVSSFMLVFVLYCLYAEYFLSQFYITCEQSFFFDSLIVRQSNETSIDIIELNEQMFVDILCDYSVWIEWLILFVCELIHRLLLSIQNTFNIHLKFSHKLSHSFCSTDFLRSHLLLILKS